MKPLTLSFLQGIHRLQAPKGRESQDRLPPAGLRHIRKSCAAMAALLFSGALLFGANVPARAAAAAKPAAGQIERPNYTVPALNARQAAAASSSTAPALAAQVGQLARNDQRQDLRLKNLEKDVDYLEQLTKSGKPAVQAVYKPPAPPSPSRQYTVRPADNLWRIAAKHHVSINDIRVANRMKSDTVVAGQRLVIPGDDLAPDVQPAPARPELYLVKPGDTFSQIAAAHRITQDTLAKANPRVQPDKLLAGAQLVIPAKSSPAVPAQIAAKTTPASAPAAKPAAARGHGDGALLTHTVRPGESLGVIAKHFGVPTASVAAANQLKNADLVVPGQRLIIPAAGSPADVAGAAAALGRTAETTLPVTKAPASLVAAPSPGAEASKPVSYSSRPIERPEPVREERLPAGGHRAVLAYRLDRGDTIETVANMFSTTPQRIRDMNNLSAGAELKEGDELIVPAVGPVSLN